MDHILSLNKFESLAKEYGVPCVDVLMIALNYEGSYSIESLPRVRMQMLPLDEVDAWQTILPMDAKDSPFYINEDALYLHDERVATIISSENDDVVLSYIRANGKNITLNTYSRSSCTGCIFCPNIIEEAADSVVKGVSRLQNLFRWIIADNGWEDLSGVNYITLCTGCFNKADLAISHLKEIKLAAQSFGFDGYLHFLSSVIRDRKDLEILAEKLNPFHLTLTLECIERRDMLLKQSKSSLTLEDALQILDDCKQVGITGDFTYVAGLDSLQTAIKGLKELASVATTFPRIQVYQSHNDYMRYYVHPEAKDLKYFLDLRTAIENDFSSKGLYPRFWENYRPLWYSEFAGLPVEGPRI